MDCSSEMTLHEDGHGHLLDDILNPRYVCHVPFYDVKFVDAAVGSLSALETNSDNDYDSNW